MREGPWGDYDELLVSRNKWKARAKAYRKERDFEANACRDLRMQGKVEKMSDLVKELNHWKAVSSEFRQQRDAAVKANQELKDKWILGLSPTDLDDLYEACMEGGWIAEDEAGEQRPTLSDAARIIREYYEFRESVWNKIAEEESLPPADRKEEPIWFSVLGSEPFPLEGVLVLVIDESEDYYLAHFNVGGWYTKNPSYKVPGVTHWRVLDEPFPVVLIVKSRPSIDF